MSITLLQLRTQARQRADAENSDFVTDAELTTYVNASIGELNDLLVQSYGSNYFTTEFPVFNTVAGQANYALPTDFYKMEGVDAKINGNKFREIKRFNFNERNRFEDGTIFSFLFLPRFRYRILGDIIRFSPIPDAGTPIKLWYIPLSVKLVADGDTLNDLNAYSEYVIVDAAIKIMQKEESDVTTLLIQKDALKERIESASQNRDAGEPESVSDITAGSDFGEGEYF